MVKYVVNPFFLFISIWCFAVLSYLGGVYTGLLPEANTITLALIFLNIIMFLLGYLTWSLFGQLNLEKQRQYQISATMLTQQNIKSALKVTYLFGIVVLLLYVYRIVIVASSRGMVFWELIANPVLMREQLVAFIDSSVYNTSRIPMLTSILISVGNSIFSIGFVLLGIFFYRENRKTRYLYVLLYLFLLISMGLLTLSRKEVVVNILYLLFAYMLTHSICRRKKPKKVFFDLFVPLISTVLLFALIDILLGKSQVYGHENRFAGFAFSLYWYIVSPLAGFNEFITNFDGNYSLGENMFFPICKWLYRLNLIELSEISVYGEKVHVPYLANVYSYLRNVYEDFGIFGIAIVPYTIGWVSSTLRRGSRIYFPVLNLYVILLVFIFFSFYNYFFISNQVYLQAFFALVFFRFDLRNLRKHDW